jgi:hypothetical protein
MTEADPASILLTDKPILRFETFGPVAKVVKEAEINVPHIFGEQGEKILEPLKSVILKYASNQSWGEIALSLSQGMARGELNELLEREIGHEGPLVIDPSASTEEHQVYQSQTHAKLQKDRLIRANESTGDILTVMYGIDSTKRDVQTRLLMHRVRMAMLTLEGAEEQDEALRKVKGLPGMNPMLQRRLAMLRQRLKNAHEKLGTADALNEDIHGELFLALATIMRWGGRNEISSHVIQNLAGQLGMLPEHFNELGVSFEGFRQALPPGEAVNRPEEKAAPVAPGPQLNR